MSRRWRNNLIYIFFAAFTLKPFHQNSPSLLLLAFILIIFNPSYCLLVAGCLSEASLRMLIIFIIFRSRCSVGLLTAKFISVLRNLILWRDSDSQIFLRFSMLILKWNTTKISAEDFRISLSIFFIRCRSLKSIKINFNFPSSPYELWN